MFWSLPMAVLGGTGAAAGIALINSDGNVGCLVGPHLIGLLRKGTPDFSASLLLIAGFFLLGCFLVGVLHLRRAAGAAPALRSRPTA